MCLNLFGSVWLTRMQSECRYHYPYQVPRFVLRNTRSCLSVKRSTIYQTSAHTFSDKVSNVVLWSIIETGIAIIVGSIPSLKPLVKSIPFFGSHHSRADRKSLNPLDEYQSYALRSSAPHGHKTLISCPSAKDRDKEDEESMKDSLINDPGIILVRSEVQVEEGSRPNTGYKSFKSFTF